MKRKRLYDLSDRQFRNRITQHMLQHSFLHTDSTDTTNVQNSLSPEAQNLFFTDTENSFSDNNLLNPVVNDLNYSLQNDIKVEKESLASISISSENASNVTEPDIIDMNEVYMENCEKEKDPEDINSFLATWATDYRITHSQLRPLLNKLKEHNCFQQQIPKDPRTLLGTPTGKAAIKTVHPGVYYHFGLSTGIEEILTKYYNKPLSNIKLKVGIDGVPLAKSSRAQFWPILASIHPFPDIFLIGVYYGHEKPTYEEEFLEDFITEVEDLCTNGFKFRENVLTCKIDCIICDAPAKSFLLNVKGHTGFHSCTKCVIRGKWRRHRVCFPHTGKVYKKRTDANIRYRMHKKHQLGYCCLRRIPNFNLIDDIPYDYMHLVCLGCMRRLIFFLIVIRSPSRLRKWQINKISKRLQKLRKYIPQEFSRKPRSLKELRFWKATEYRQFVLYTGSFIFKGILPQKLYTHFNTLHVAMRILCSKKLVKRPNYLDYANELLSYFVKCLTFLFGSYSVSYNMHGLLHLVDDARKRGCLDNFSAFDFENYLQQLKKWMRKGEKPLEQLVRRYAEFKKNSAKLTKSQVNEIKINENSQHCNGPLLEGCSSPEYHELTIREFRLDVLKLRDSCFGLLNKDIILILNIAHHVDSNEIVVIGKNFETVRNLYSKPCESSLLNEFIVSDLSSLKMWPLKNVKRKFMIVPLNRSEYVVSSLLHTD
ncbi:uncharacterized protein LOC122502304 isoform X1 [Leptopilina heterotoma]|uniref:uncharacterized protein LOC122502304 isoform X1 n=1 Tax=Leptopilina heterotoma TaxID=63436 RepID=UPI001CA95D49|nr:uncharacterized protein LOC122502304 isoform X1 [Leptopilina heterotoma]XP_043468220.1 uncharacterized protein LOC122502304 isoform X1 [Leptopilina heterotoma]